MSAAPSSPTSPSLPADLAAAHAMILSERAMRIEAQAAASSVEATIAHLKLMIEKLRRELYGQRAERTARLIDQMELQLEGNYPPPCAGWVSLIPCRDGSHRS